MVSCWLIVGQLVVSGWLVGCRVDKKRDKLERKVLDSQERAFWDVHRPAVSSVCLSLSVSVIYKLPTQTNTSAISFPHLSTDFFQCHKLVSGPCKDEDPPVHIHCNSLLTVEHILISCVDVLMSFAKFLYSF